MNKFLSKVNTKENKRAIGIGLVLALSAGYAFATGPGHATDWSGAFRAWALGLPHEMGVWNPDWGKLLLLPFAWLPQNIGHMILNIIMYSGIWYASGQLWSFLTFAVNDQAWVGNLDGFVIWGMVLARLSNAYLVGVGLFLISIKPQYLPLGIYYIWRCRNIRIFVFPLLALLLTFVIWGNWLPEWLATLPPTPHKNVNVSFFPWAIPVWLLLPFAVDKERFVAAATILSVPYFNQVSLIILFAFTWNRWVIIPLILLSWISPPLLAPFALVYAMIVTTDQKLTNPVSRIAARV